MKNMHVLRKARRCVMQGIFLGHASIVQYGWSDWKGFPNQIFTDNYNRYTSRSNVLLGSAVNNPKLQISNKTTCRKVFHVGSCCPLLLRHRSALRICWKTYRKPK